MAALAGLGWARPGPQHFSGMTLKASKTCRGAPKDPSYLSPQTL